MTDELERIQKERADRKAALAEARREQLVTDLEALNVIEIERGDDNVGVVKVSRFAPGVPTFAVVRASSKVELKRYRDLTKEDGADNAAAAAQAGRAAWLYPPKDSVEYTTLNSMVPGLEARAGVVALELATGIEGKEGKV